MMYTMGGWDDGEYLLCIDLKKQKELWKVKVGKLFSYGKWGDGPRGNPTVHEDHVYALGSYGDLVCVHATKGKELWRKSFVDDLGGVMMSEWGYSEGPLVDGDRLIVTPGGAKGTLAALDRKTGDVIWRSEGLTHAAPYSSVMISNAAGVKQYIQNGYIVKEPGEGFVSGFDAKNGKPLWTEKTFSHSSYAIAPTPIIQDDLVYITTGYGGGCHLYQLTKGEKGLEVKDLYKGKTQKNMTNTHGGVVLIAGHIYGHSESNRWQCQEMKTGKVAWSERTECRTGAIAAADGRIYLYGEDGEAILLVPNPKEWGEAGRFKIPELSKIRMTNENFSQAAIWTHPVVANGRLYLRDQELIFCFDVKK
jgi:outer membrane protein assembly factor BamB